MTIAARMTSTNAKITWARFTKMGTVCDTPVYNGKYKILLVFY